MSLKAITKTFEFGENYHTTVLGIGYDEQALWHAIYTDEDYTFPSMYGDPAVQCTFVTSVSTDRHYIVVVMEEGNLNNFGTITYEIVDTNLVSSKF